MTRPTLYIDRDGTLIDEPKTDFQIDSLEKLRFERDVIPALLRLQTHYRLVIVSNQDGLGSASFPQASFDTPHNKMLETFASQGIRFDAVYICPHRAEDGCTCRKPQIGLLRDEIAASRFDPAHSYVIGDRDSDLQLAQNLGITGLRYHPDHLGWAHIAEKLLPVAATERAPRRADVHRQTRETDIRISLDLDRAGINHIRTGIGFFDHMLDQIATHGGFQMNIDCAGDLHIDEHHSIEDTAFALGEALRQALGDKRGIARFGFVLPMDECRAKCTLDLSGRPYCCFKAEFKREQVGGFATEMTEHFFYSLSQSLKCTLHLKAKGRNDHHKIESLFKAFGRTLRQAIRIEGSELPSSKGVL